MLDVNSGAVHVVDDIVYDVIASAGWQDKTKLDTGDAACERANIQLKKIKEALEECQELKDAGCLFTEDIYERAIEDFQEHVRPL